MKLLFWGKTSDTHTFIVKGEMVCIYWRNYSSPTFTLKGCQVISRCNSNVILKPNSPFGSISVMGEGDYTWKPEGVGYVFVDPTGRKAWFDEGFNLLSEEFFTEEEESLFLSYKKDLKKKKAFSFLGWALLAGVLFYLYKIFFGDK